MKAPLSTINAVIAISAGVIVLLGYFVPGLDFLRDLVLHWALVLAAFALIVGVANLLSIHGRKVTTRKAGAVYSLVLILAFVVTLIIVALPPMVAPALSGAVGPTGYWAQWLVRYVQVPVEGSLLAILAVTLAVAVVRLLQRRSDAMVLIFVATIVVMLLGSVPIYTQAEGPILTGLRTWISTWLGTAGVRGLLIGIALGTVAAGLRVLMGVDRPYGG